MQSVLCEGPVDTIVSKLMSNVSSTIQSQVTSAVAKHATLTPQQSLSEILSRLASLWRSSSSTQVALLVTQIVLEIGLSNAIQSASNLKEFVTEVDSMIETVCGMLNSSRGVEREDERVSEVNMASISAVKSSTSTEASDTGPPAYAKQSIISTANLPKFQQIKLQSLQVILMNYKLKARNLSEPGSSNLNETFEWQSLLHYVWSSREQKCFISSLGPRLSYGYQYTGTSSRMMVTPLLERALFSLIMAVGSGIGALIDGPNTEVHV